MASFPLKQQAQSVVRNPQQSAVGNSQQAPAGCGLCKTGMTITSICLTCDILLCENCRHHHLKQEIFQDHRMNYIKDIGKKFEIFSVKTFTTDLQITRDVLPDKGDKVWIGCYDYGDNVLYQIQLQDQHFIIINRINIYFKYMAKLSLNKILLSTGGSRLKLLDTETGEVTDSVYDVHPFQSLGFNITKDNNIITGCGHETEDVDTSTCKVMILDKNGTRLAVYEHDQHNQPIFTCPRSITSTSNGYIHVVDYYLMDDRGRVIVLDRDGHVISRYTGIRDINRYSPFQPTNIVTTPEDMVIVPDPESDALHILDSTGQLVTFINTRDKGILGRFSVAFMDDGHLLIGCYEFHDEPAKFHKVKISNT